jgi:chemotaxis protein methyltransferase CheR
MTPIINSSIPEQQQQSVLWIKDWVQSNTGIFYTETKVQLFYQRLQSLIIQLNLPDINALAQAIQTQSIPDINRQISQVATTNHTFFFREPEVLNYFTHQISPLYANEVCRIWSAASSSGEEPYTLSIMLAEKYGLNQARRQISMLATDLSQDMVTMGSKGLYHQRRLEGMSPDIRKRWFSVAGLDSWKIHPELHKMILFRRLNLQDNPWPFKKAFHVVFLRNVLYYFKKEDQRKVVEQIYDVRD